MVRWMAPYSTPFSWPSSKPCARRVPSGRPCSGTGYNCFSAQPKTAPTCGERPSRKVRARCFRLRWPWGWASTSSRRGESDHARQPT
eukprot:8557740-Alexandrium_andersonii.AAC.1